MPVQYLNDFQLEHVIAQMKDKGVEFEDELADYFEGETRTYYFNRETGTFACRRMDTIAASYTQFDRLTECELKIILSKFSINEFKKQGFTIHE